MAQQIFISYSSGDQAAADAVCKSLEASGGPYPRRRSRREPALIREGVASTIARVYDPAMDQPITGPTGAITGYHAHVYYDEATRAEAAVLREAADKRFKVVLGRWRDMPVGPHPQAMYQIAFGVEEFPRLVPWLMVNRGNLVVLVHPLTDDEYEDHGHHALWLGAVLPLKLDILKHAPTEPANR